MYLVSSGPDKARSDCYLHAFSISFGSNQRARARALLPVVLARPRPPPALWLWAKVFFLSGLFSYSRDDDLEKPQRRAARPTWTE